MNANKAILMPSGLWGYDCALIKQLPAVGLFYVVSRAASGLMLLLGIQR